jgi:hypothetical protein
MNASTPDLISHDALLAALEMKSLESECEDTNYADPVPSVYRIQLRHSLLSFARRMHLAAAVHKLTGLPESEVSKKSTAELLVLLNRKRCGG